MKKKITIRKNIFLLVVSFSFESVLQFFVKIEILIYLDVKLILEVKLQYWKKGPMALHLSFIF